MQYLGFAFLAMICLEILSIMLMVGAIGGWATLGLMILSFFLGSFILRRNAGFSKILMTGEILRAKNGVSIYQMMWPIRIPLAGFLLMVPGFVSSIAAIVLLLPIKGKPVMDAHNQTFGATFGNHPFQQNPRANDEDIIDGDFVVRNQPFKQNTRPLNPSDIIEHQKD